MDKPTVKKKSVNQVVYNGKTYTCNGERVIVDGQVRWMYRTKKGMDYDILICDDRYSENPEFSHLKKMPGGGGYYSGDDAPVPPTPATDNYLTFKCVSDSAQISIIKDNRSFGSFEYSLDSGETWSTYTENTPISLSDGETVKFRGENTDLAYFDSCSASYHKFVITGGNVEASGDVTSLLNGEGGDVDLSTLSYMCGMSNLFGGCTYLTKAPNLPSTKIGAGCYAEMFYGCTSLVEAPELPATGMADSCYYSMFGGCTSLVEAPELPATTLANSCYFQMFNGCTSLVEAPELPATTLASNCYGSMFIGCTSLNKVVCNAGSPSSSYTYNWMYDVTTTGSFYKNPDAEWESGVNGVPEGWTQYDIQ